MILKDTLKKYEGWWATKPVRVKEGILFSYYAPWAKGTFLIILFIFGAGGDILPQGHPERYNFTLDGRQIYPKT